MPNCSKCSNSQARLNKGALCKTCFQRKIHKVMNSSRDNGTNEDINIAEVHEREVINLIKDNMSQEKAFNSEIVTLLKEQIEHMKTEITHKNTLIENLMTELYNRNNTESNACHINNEHSNSLSTINNHHEEVITDSLPDNRDEWQKINERHSTFITPEVKWNLPLVNRFNGMPIEECVMTDDNMSETDSQRSVNNVPSTIKKDNYNNNNGKVYINQRHYNDLPLRNVATKLTKRKILILSASITKPINMVKFNEGITNGYAVKRAYGGATTTRLKHYVKGDIAVDKPDTIIINGGTNNFTKTSLSDEEIVDEICEIVDICRQYGVKSILVSSITCRPEFQRRVDAINILLKEKAIKYDYEFIDNARIGEFHLKRDKLHLNQQGIFMLANNFLSHLNQPYKTLPFTSIWD